MRLISWLFTLFVLFIALCFAVNNRQSATISLWPFGIEVVAPLYLLSLGTLFLGLLMGVLIGWVSHLPHRIEARRLRRDIADMRDRIEDLRAAAPVDGESAPGAQPKKRLWGKSA